MSTSRAVDVLVVGNGVLGLSVALQLARQDPALAIAVVGPKDRGMAASAAAGAMLNCFGEVTRYTTRHPAAQARFAIARQALDRWPTWLERLAEDAGPAVGGAVRSSHTDGSFILLGGRSGPIATDNFDAIHAALVDHGEPHDLPDPHEIEGLAPRPDARPMRALYLEREGALDARALLAALGEAASRHSVHIVPGTVRTLLANGNAVTGVQLHDGSTLTADTTVLAAGAASGTLAAEVLPPGAVPPMLYGTGVALIVRRTTLTGSGAPHVMRTPNRAATCGLHLVPLPATRQQYIGATNLITTEPISGAEFGSTHALMRQVCEQVDHHLAFARIQRLLAGARPIPLDCFPLIGDCSLRGLIFATGTYRDGLHCSPAIAHHIATTILGTTAQDPDFAWFTPERAPISTLSVEDAITETALHAVDTTHEQGMQMPFWLGSEPIRDWILNRTRQLYDALDGSVALAPEIIFPQFVNAESTDDHDAVTKVRNYLRAAREHHATKTLATSAH